eukprot:scaffold60052_cov59-Phaeocystis_antarctica.AAC.6
MAARASLAALAASGRVPAAAVAVPRCRALAASSSCCCSSCCSRCNAASVARISLKAACPGDEVSGV